MDCTIVKPMALFYCPGGTTHRVTDSKDRVRIVPAPPTSYIVYTKQAGDPQLVDF